MVYPKLEGGVPNPPITIDAMSAFLLMCDHLKATLVNVCPGCTACDKAKEAAHEVFFQLPPEMRDVLCTLCFEAELSPIAVFGWEREDFLRPVE
jgi:hypothetical protein